MTTKRNASPILRLSYGAVLCAILAAAPGAAHAADWINGLKFYGHAEGGIAFNTANPANTENFGDLFTDKANVPQLNQLMMAVEKPVDTSADHFDWGFKLEGMFGTDARYTHALAETDHLTHSRYQFDINEASVTLHFASLFKNGIDFRIGQIPSPFSAESIDASANSLYSHSYIFNFGVPMKSTGVLAIAHASPMLDLYAGLDTGENGGITADGDNNRNIKGQFGFGLNGLDGG
ncbi:MAG: outer membrane beta-barrel protein, partial [Alphaproteobacteria bacterium]|nr:outer membrane beta-barrel protein [Alphaproteobacteria bacterium]